MKSSSGTVKSPNPPRRGLRRPAVTVGVAALAVSAAFGIGSMTIAGAQAPATSSGIVLGVGAKASQRVVSWYTSANTAQSVQVAPTSTLVNGAFRASAVSFAATVTANTVNGGFNGHAIIDGLQEDTAYSYRVGAEGAWSQTYSFKTQKFDGAFDFLFFGDPQIGSSGDVSKDGAGWQDTLNVSLAANPDAELLVSGGDQVETANTETQWNAFLASDKLRQYPWAATIGNHDVGGKAYDQHFWTPNTDRSAPFYSGNANTQSGGDYWYVYKDVLFIHLNSNAYDNGSDAAHVGYVRSVVEAHGAEAKYTVLVYHHSIYSPAAHADDGDNQVRRRDFPTAFSKLGVDLVLQGHDHSYSRSYALKNGQKAKADEQPGANQVAKGPGGVIYVTGNSASGSKYYDLHDPARGLGLRSGPAGPHRQAPLRQLGGEPGARPDLRQGPGSRRRPRRREHPQRHLRRAERGGRGRQRVLVRPRQRCHPGPAGRLRGRQGRHPRGRGAPGRGRRRRGSPGDARADARHVRELRRLRARCRR